MDQLSTKNEVLVVLTTWPDREKARAAARQLVEEKLAACGNLIPGVESIYRWQGQIETSAEVLVIFKTTAELYSKLEARIRQLHTYEIPEIVGLPVAQGLPEYLRWVEQSCASLEGGALCGPPSPTAPSPLRSDCRRPESGR